MLTDFVPWGAVSLSALVGQHPSQEVVLQVCVCVCVLMCVDAGVGKLVAKD